VLDLVHITLNKNSVPGDQSAVVPGGIRIGTPALTTRGFREQDFVRVADLLHRGIQVAQVGPGAAWVDGVQLLRCMVKLAAGFRCETATLRHMLTCLQDCKAKTPAPGKLKEFQAYLASEGGARQDVQQLKAEVHEFASGFDMPGGDW
jgi:glycine hydroxymethyltransferase